MFSEPAPAALAQKRHCHLHGGLCTRRFDLLEWFDSNMRPSMTFNNCVFVTIPLILSFEIFLHSQKIINLNWIGIGESFTKFAMFYIKSIYIFWKLLKESADHPVLISIWWENVKYLRCDGHGHDNAKENDAVFKTGPNCRWWQEGEDMQHTRCRPNWPFTINYFPPKIEYKMMWEFRPHQVMGSSPAATRPLTLGEKRQQIICPKKYKYCLANQK